MGTPIKFTFCHFNDYRCPSCCTFIDERIQDLDGPVQRPSQKNALILSELGMTLSELCAGHHTITPSPLHVDDEKTCPGAWWRSTRDVRRLSTRSSVSATSQSSTAPRSTGGKLQNIFR